MKFGLFILGEKPPSLSGAEVYRRNIEQCIVADELGYDTIWLAEHHFSPYGTIADPFVFGAAVAQATSRIRIGSAVVIPSFMNPIRLAERVAMVDALSEGRYDFGVGRGYQAHEFRRFGISMDESRERFIETMDIVEGLLNNETFSWEGQFSSGEDVALYPRPVQDPVPVFVAVLKTVATIDWVVQRGYGAMVGNPYIPDPELSKSLELLKESHQKVDKSHTDTEIWALTTAFAHKDRKFARAYPKQSIEINLEFVRKYAVPFAKGEPVPREYAAYADWHEGVSAMDYEGLLNLDTTLIGSVDEVTEKLCVMHERDGWENFILTINKGGAMDQAEVLKAMELFALQIIPAVKQNQKANVQAP